MNGISFYLVQLFFCWCLPAYGQRATLREAFLGNAAAARESAKPALKVSNDREVEYGGDWRWLSVRYMPARTPSGLPGSSPSAGQ